MRDLLDVARHLPRGVGSARLPRIFDPLRTTSITGVRIVDVGQGDCIGLLDQRGNVCAYVDFGGYLDHPDATHPARNAQRMPVQVDGRLVPIIVTHWDQDHIYSAHAYNTQAQQCDWLVPRQWVSPFAAQLAAKLKGARCWPESLGQRVRAFNVGRCTVEIRKCQPWDRKRPKEDRNLSGLAITILETRGARVRQIVLPGDCPFDRIPHVQQVQIRHLVAYHHGARTHWNAATTRFIDQKPLLTPRSLSYSYSPKNNYEHPQRQSYRPNWNRVALSTPVVRRKGQMYVDVKWGPWI